MERIKYPDDLESEAFEAVESGDAVLLREVLQQMNNNERTSALETAYITEDVMKDTLLDLLIVAAGNGNLDCVKVLLEHGANVDLQNIVGETPLMVASEYGHVDVVSFLVEHGADTNLQDEEGLTSLKKACSNNYVDVVALLVQHGADVDLQDEDGNTALHYILYHAEDHYNEYCDVLSCLITNGADVNACTHDNCTPLMIASRNAHINAVTFLVEHGANMDLQDKNGNTALHYAVTSGKAEAGGCCVVEKLLTLGASQLYNNKQLTPLLEASNKCQSLMVEHLLKGTENTKEQRIDALELLGASLATQATPHTAEAFHYIKCGMTERFQDPSQPLFKQPMEPVEAYQFRKESQTLEELAQIEGDRYAIIMEGLVIRERILGTVNTALLEPIKNVASFSKYQNFDVAMFIGLYIHAMKIAQHCNGSFISELYWVTIGLDQDSDFRNVFLSQEDFVLELFEVIVLEYEKQEKTGRYEPLEFQLEDLRLLFDSTITFLLTIAKFRYREESKTLHASVLLKKLCHLNPRYHDGTTLLHHAVEHYVGHEFACLDTVKLLLNAGINVNGFSNNGNTPLHTAVKLTPSNEKIQLLSDILQVLLDGGTHHDFVNNDGKTAMDMAQTDELRAILFEKSKLELKCISARAVKKFGLPYLGVVPTTLEKYISMH